MYFRGDPSFRRRREMARHNAAMSEKARKIALDKAQAEGDAPTAAELADWERIRKAKEDGQKTS